ncbi:MAG: hypothetical protein HPY69_00805 [Armatimonadetes bacterium]|nr:hypothetical protein [Armatimonadota bacterium]
MTGYRRLPALLLPSALALLVCLVGSCQQPGLEGTTSDAEAKVDVLSQDIQILYTLNRLDLKPEQYTTLLGIIDRMAAEVAPAQAQREAALKELAPLLSQKRAALLEDKEPGEELEDQIREVQGRADDAYGLEVETRSKYAAEFRKALSPEQTAIITGADEAATQAAELLNWIRELPEAEYAEEAEANAQELADPEVGLNAEAILRIFSEARKLSAEEYAQKLPGFTTELAKIYMPMPDAADESLADWFGAPRLAVLLRERASKLGGQ